MSLLSLKFPFKGFFWSSAFSVLKEELSRKLLLNCLTSLVPLCVARSRMSCYIIGCDCLNLVELCKAPFLNNLELVWIFLLTVCRPSS